jgi:hypothetical protein
MKTPEKPRLESIKTTGARQRIEVLWKVNRLSQGSSLARRGRCMEGRQSLEKPYRSCLVFRLTVGWAVLVSTVGESARKREDSLALTQGDRRNEGGDGTGSGIADLDCQLPEAPKRTLTLPPHATEAPPRHAAATNPTPSRVGARVTRPPCPSVHPRVPHPRPPRQRNRRTAERGSCSSIAFLVHLRKGVLRPHRRRLGRKRYLCQSTWTPLMMTELHRRACGDQGLQHCPLHQRPQLARPNLLPSTARPEHRAKRYLSSERRW